MLPEGFLSSGCFKISTLVNQNKFKVVHIVMVILIEMRMDVGLWYLLIRTVTFLAAFIIIKSFPKWCDATAYVLNITLFTTEHVNNIG